MKKRLPIILLTLFILIVALASTVTAANSGTCGKNLTWTFQDGLLTISGTGDMERYYRTQTAPWYSLDITEVIIEEGVTSIGDCAFFKESNLKKVTLPSSLTEIRECAFEYCTALSEIQFPESLERLWDGSFYHCDSLTEITIPDSVTLFRSPFTNCTNLKKVVFGDGLDIIRGSAFMGCINLVEVDLGNSITEIGGSCFEDCESLTYIELPDSLETISNRAFYNCSLTDIHWGKNLKSIGQYAFYGNDFEHLLLPDSLETLNKFSFSRCNGLVTITFGKGLSIIPDQAFQDSNNVVSYTFGPNITKISSTAFNGNINHFDIYFTGTEEEYNKVDMSLDTSGQISYGNNPEIHFNSHIHDFESEVTAPNCQEKGYTTYTCNCGATLVSRYAPIIDHIYDEVGIVVPPTCTDYGYTKYPCIMCHASNTISDSVPPTGHSYKGTVETNPTCTVSGTMRYRCENCTSTYISQIDPLGHDYTNVEILKEATYYDPGEKKSTCGTCGYELIEEIPTLVLFEDVTGKSYYRVPVIWAYESNITKGITATTFEPETECTRGQVVTFLWRAVGSPEPESDNNPFTDVAPGRFYYKAVLWAVENGITSGTTKTTFSPDDTCTRGQVVTFLWRTASSPVPTSEEHPFTDVDSARYYYKAVLWAVENNITSGITKTTFEPDSHCNRAQVVTFLYRHLAES